MRWRIRLALGEGNGPLVVLEPELEADDLRRPGCIADCAAEVAGAEEPKAGCEMEEGSRRPLVASLSVTGGGTLT